MSDRNVADELALRELVARYADAVCRRDAAAWGATWAADGEWQIMGQTVQGRDEIVALWERLMGGIPQVIQIPHEGLIEIEGDRASLRWYVTEQGKLADGSALVMSGVYLDECVKEDEVWLFQTGLSLPLQRPARPFRRLPAPAGGTGQGPRGPPGLVDPLGG